MSDTNSHAVPLAPQSLLSLGRRQNSLGASIESPRKSINQSMGFQSPSANQSINPSSLERQTSSGSVSGQSINQSSNQSNAWSSLQDREPPSGQRRWVDYGNNDRSSDRPMDRSSNNDRPGNAWKRNDRSRFDREGGQPDDRSINQSTNQSFTSMAPMSRSRSDHSDESSGNSRFARFDRDRAGDQRSGFDRGGRYDNDRSNYQSNQSINDGGRFDRAYNDRDRVTDWGDRTQERVAPKRDFRGNYQSTNQSTGRFNDQDASYDDLDRTSPNQGPMQSPHSRQSSSTGLSLSQSGNQSTNQSTDQYPLGAADIARLNTKFGPSSNTSMTYSKDVLLSLYKPIDHPPHQLIESLTNRSIYQSMIHELPQKPYLSTPLTEQELTAKASGAWFLPHRSYQSTNRRVLPNSSMPRRQVSAGSINQSTNQSMPAWADSSVSSIDLNAIHEQTAAIETERLSMRRAAEWSEAQAASHALAANQSINQSINPSINQPINPPPSLAVKWYYKDPQGVVQGPFTGADMKDWYEKGYFDLELPVQCTPVNSPPPTSFASLGTWFGQGRSAFLDTVPQLNNQPINQSVNQSNNQSIDRSIGQSLNQPISQPIDNQHDSILRRGAVGLGSWGSEHDQPLNQSMDRLSQSVGRGLRIDDELDHDHRFGGQTIGQSPHQQQQHWNSSFNAQPNQSINLSLNQWQQFPSPSPHSGFLNIQSPSATKSLHFGSMNAQSLNQPISQSFNQHDPWLHSAAMPNSAQQIHFGTHGPPSPVIHAQQLAMEQQQMMQRQQQQQQHFNQPINQSINQPIGQQRASQPQQQQHDHVLNQSMPSQYNQQQAAALARERMMQSNTSSPSLTNQTISQSNNQSVASPFVSFGKRESVQSSSSSPSTFSPVNQPINQSVIQPATSAFKESSSKPAPVSITQPTVTSPTPLIPTATSSIRSPVSAVQPAASPVNQSSNQSTVRWAPPASKALSLAEIQNLELEESRRRAAIEAHRVAEENAVEQASNQPAWGKAVAAPAHQSKPSLSEIMNEENSRTEISAPTKIEQTSNQAKELKKKVSVPLAAAAPSKPASAWGVKTVVAPKAVDLRSIQEQEEAERLRAEEQAAARLREQQAAASLASANPGSVWGSLHPLVAQSVQKPPMSLKEIQAMEFAAHPAPVSNVKSAASLVSTPAWSSSLSSSKPSPTSSKTESIWDTPSSSSDVLRSKPKAKAAPAPSVSAQSSVSQSSSNNTQTSAFGVSVHMSDELATWCRRELQSLTGSNDLTLVQYLLTLESDELIEETIIAYFGASDAVKKFARSFCQLSQFDREQTQGSTSSASSYSTAEKAKDTSTVKKSASAARRKRAGGK